MFQPVSPERFASDPAQAAASGLLFDGLQVIAWLLALTAVAAFVIYLICLALLCRGENRKAPRRRQTRTNAQNSSQRARATPQRNRLQARRARYGAP